MRTLFFSLSVCVGLSAWYSPLSAKPMTDKDFEIAMRGAKELSLETQKIESRYSFKDQFADIAFRQLKKDRYVCVIEHLDMPVIAKNSLVIQMVQKPLIFCTQKSTAANDFCGERQVNFMIAWKDPNARDPQLRAQLASSRVISQAFRCVEPSEVGR